MFFRLYMLLLRPRQCLILFAGTTSSCFFMPLSTISNLTQMTIFSNQQLFINTRIYQRCSFTLYFILDTNCHFFRSLERCRPCHILQSSWLLRYQVSLKKRRSLRKRFKMRNRFTIAYGITTTQFSQTMSRYIHLRKWISRVPSKRQKFRTISMMISTKQFALHESPE